jgi:sodium transport system permease protein
MKHPLLKQIGIVFSKELVDALRDRRTLLRVILPGLLIGPLMLLFMSMLVAQFESQAKERKVSVYGLEHAPSLANYIARQNYGSVAVKGSNRVEAFEKGLRSGQLSSPVLVVQPDFEAKLARGEPAELEVVTDSANTRASVGVGPLVSLVRGFNQERAQLQLVLRGVAGTSLEPVELTERDLASPGARAVRITSFIPMLVIMAVLYGCLTAALDATSGERERGSLEPLLTNPVQHITLASGKWLAVSLMGAVVATCASFSFLPAQLLIKSDALAAQFRFGWIEAATFAALLMPVAMSMGALLMAIAIRTKTFKESQASANLLIMCMSFMPLVAIMNPGADAAWHYWVPGLGQYQQMMQILKGETLTARQWMPPLLTASGIVVGGLWYVARQMRSAAAR